MDLQNHPARRESALSGVRMGLAIVTLGFFLLFAGAVFSLPFALSPNAIQNDVYMTNLFLAPSFAVVGVVLLFAGFLAFLRSSAARRRRERWVWTIVFALAGAGIVTVASFLVGGRYESFPPGSIYWPPYLNGWMLTVTAVVGAGVAVAAWLWAAREPGGARVGVA